MSYTVRLKIEGRVQMVGFRYWTVGQARDLGLDGFVKNLGDGSVEVLAAGAKDTVEQLITACQSGPPGARVDNISILQQWDQDVKNLIGRGFREIR